MEAFISLDAVAAPLARINVDTDQIIPAVYLKRVTRTGFEDGLFAGWRTDPSFILNLPPFDRGSVLVAGPDFGTGSSRDWAAKGTQLLGIKAVVARSFERIHRANLVGMGVLPLQFMGDDSWESLGIKGDEEFDIELGEEIRPQQDATLVIRRADGSQRRVTLRLRIDTPIEVDYYKHGGILPDVLRQLLAV